MQTGTSRESDLVHTAVEVEYDITSLGAFLQCARRRPTGRLAYSRMLFRSSVGSALLYALMDLIRSWYALGIFWLTCKLVVYPVFVFVDVARLTKTD